MPSHTHSSVHKPLNTVTNKPALVSFLLHGPHSCCTSVVKQTKAPDQKADFPPDDGTAAVFRDENLNFNRAVKVNLQHQISGLKYNSGGGGVVQHIKI